MIKQIRASYYHNKKNAQYCALSTDVLPSYIQHGDEVYFIDTGIPYWYNGVTGELVQKVTLGVPGPQGQGVPSGGEQYDVLLKSTNGNFDTMWGNIKVFKTENDELAVKAVLS